MARRIVHPFGLSIPANRVFTLLLTLAILWVMYDTIRQPLAWRWLADGTRIAQSESEGKAAGPEVDEIIAGPNDTDPAELADFKRLEELLKDRVDLRPREMPLYWKLVGWANSQTFAELAARAKSQPAFTQLWDQPAKHRAQPISMRLHIRRVLEFDAPENPFGIKKIYEAWGTTDDSKSFPYVVVFTQKPRGMPVGPDAWSEVDFAGYFLKIMSYKAFDVKRGAPLLIGRVKLAPIEQFRLQKAAESRDTSIYWIYGVGTLLAIGMGWAVIRRTLYPQGKRPGVAQGLFDTAELPDTSSNFTFGANDTPPPPSPEHPIIDIAPFLKPPEEPKIDPQ